MRTGAPLASSGRRSWRRTSLSQAPSLRLKVGAELHGGEPRSAEIMPLAIDALATVAVVRAKGRLQSVEGGPVRAGRDVAGDSDE